ncbi:hypothetical protein REPUB_Repub13aG0024100 [Reevesia pubescens]
MPPERNHPRRNYSGAVTSVFVNNIPQKVHWRWLWTIFEHYGRVLDVFIPRKRSRLGKRYGFVRFASRPAALTAIKSLNGAWLLNSRIGVNIARFRGRTSYWRKIPTTTNPPANASSSVQVPPTTGISNSFQADKVATDPHLAKTSEDADFMLTKTYLEALNTAALPDTTNDLPCSPSKSMKQTSVPLIKSCPGVVENEMLHLLESCVIAVARDYFEAYRLTENFRISGVSGVYARKISGRQFLIKFDDKDLLEAMEEQDWTWLREWFDDIFRWLEDFSSRYRVTWLSCFGVPLHGWNYETFRNIASLWGVLISLDAKTLELKDFSKSSLMIMTDQLEKIDESIQLHCGSKSFSVRVSEIGDEWISLFHCCCKPRSASVPLSKPNSGNATEPFLEDEQYSVSADDTDRNFVGLNTDMCGIDIPQKDSSILDASLPEHVTPNRSPTSPTRENLSFSQTDVLNLPSQAGLRPGPDFTPPNLDLPLPLTQPISLSSLNPDEVQLPCEAHLSIEVHEQNTSKPLCLSDVEFLHSNEIESEGGSDDASHLNFKRKSRKTCTLEDIFAESDRRRKCNKKKLLRGKKKNTFILQSNDKSIANGSLSDEDFQRRNKFLTRRSTASDAWNLGKMISYSATCDDDLVIDEISKLDDH